MLVDGPGCFFFLNLQNAHFTSDHYQSVFLELLNRVKSQKSALILIFDSAELYDYFSRYLNIFEIYENRNAYKKSGTKKQLQQIGLHYGLRSGITISSGVAVAFLSLIVGWIVTLLIIISTQGHDLSDKQAKSSRSRTRRNAISRKSTNWNPLSGLSASWASYRIRPCSAPLDSSRTGSVI